MSLKILRDVEGSAISVIDIDATISHQIKMSATLTDHTIEDGSVITDHAVKQPTEITVTGFVSNFPGSLVTGGLSIIPQRDDTRRQTAYQALKELMATTERVQVQDELDLYESYAMTDLVIPRDAETHNGIQFTATFRKVVVIATQDVEIAAADAPLVSPAADVGTVTADDSTVEEEAQGSLLHQALFQ